MLHHWHYLLHVSLDVMGLLEQIVHDSNALEVQSSLMGRERYREMSENVGLEMERAVFNKVMSTLSVMWSYDFWWRV